MRWTAWFAMAGVAMIAAQGGCSSSVDQLGSIDRSETGDASVGFGGPPDASSEDARGELITYCPSNECPRGHTNCLTSIFPCDVDLLSDRQNCGSCGAACPPDTYREKYECSNGRCVMQCSFLPKTLDCDGLPDNGCEVDPITDDACDACDTKCTDPARPCVPRNALGQHTCGCADHETACGRRCTDTETDDFNCKTCGTVCDPTEGGPPPDASMHAYYGCIAGACGKLKCQRYWGDCDGDPSNGCETSLLTNDHCARCEVACGPNQTCARDSEAGLKCMCDGNDTFCPGTCRPGFPCTGSCADLNSDPGNCGGCGISCTRAGFINGATTADAVCINGTCAIQCTNGYSDCNGNEADGCEVNTDGDPRNCGGCGTVCDAIDKQACVKGKCVVEPCDRGESDGGVGPQ